MVSFSAFPGPSGSGRSSVSPWYSTRSRASTIPTTATYSRVRCNRPANRCPCQRPAPPPPRRAPPGGPPPRRGAPRPAPPRAPGGPPGAEAERPPPAAELVDRRRGHGGHGGGAAGHLEDRGAELDRRRRLREPRED